MALAISFSNTVFPVLGWATISPRCPFPIGQNKSTIRVERVSFLPLQRLNFTSGKRGVRCSNGTRSRTYSGERPLIWATLISGKYFSPSFGGRIAPLTVSPVFRPNSFTCLRLRYNQSTLTFTDRAE